MLQSQQQYFTALALILVCVLLLLASQEDCGYRICAIQNWWLFAGAIVVAVVGGMIVTRAILVKPIALPACIENLPEEIQALSASMLIVGLAVFVTSLLAELPIIAAIVVGLSAGLYVGLLLVTVNWMAERCDWLPWVARIIIAGFCWAVLLTTAPFAALEVINI